MANENDFELEGDELNRSKSSQTKQVMSLHNIRRNN
jgi:hypothetical protein